MFYNKDAFEKAGSETTEAVAAGDFKNEAVLKTAQVLEDMIKKRYIDPRASGNVYPQGQSHIADGSVDMYLNGSWQIQVWLR